MQDYKENPLLPTENTAAHLWLSKDHVTKPELNISKRNFLIHQKQDTVPHPDKGHAEINFQSEINFVD